MPTVADYIEQNRERIQQRYAEEVGQLPLAKGLSFNERIDTLPEYLRTLERNSRAGRRANIELTARRLEETHIGLRLRQGFKKDDVIGEYVLLGRIITSLWEQEPATARPDPDDVRLLLDELRAAMDQVVQVFTGYGSDERQAEKHFLRRLDTLATQLIEQLDAAPAAHQWVPPLLETVREAMNADGAALFLVEDDGGSLRLTATAGRAADTAASVPAGAAAFVAEVAAADAPLYLPDAANAAGRVSAELGGSGLRSLLGLRLFPNGRLRGVLYIGVDRVRLFEPRAQRYFESLIDHLSGIVDRTLLIAEMQRTRRQLRLLLDSAVDGIYGVDADGRCIFANPACVRLLGYRSSDELIGKPMHDLIHHTKPDGSPYPADECPLLQAVRAGRTYAYRSDLLWRADGSSFYADQRAAPIRDAGEGMVAVISFTDVTARLRAEAEREDLLARTQRAVGVRQEIVRIVSHDLRNPLAAIITAAGLLLRYAAASEQGRRVRKNAGLIQRAAHRMSRLIDDLTDFGSIEAGTLAVRLEPRDPGEIVREAYEGVLQTADEQGLRLALSLPERLPVIACDRDRVLQVLENLLANAFKVSGRGALITLGAEAQADAVRFFVSDTGPGIAPDELPQLFDRYWRGQRAGYRGTGLGLAIAEGLVRAHAGRIWAESTLGEGSTFHFTIPRAAAGAPAPAGSV